VLLVKLTWATGAFDVTAALVYNGSALITGIRTAEMGVLVLGQYYQSGSSTPYFIGSDGAVFGIQPPAGEPASHILRCREAGALLARRMR
jgi:hypothetical protein